MEKRKNWLVRLLILLFTLSVSVTVVPCGSINVYGLFGDIRTSVVTEDADRTIENITSNRLHRFQKVKGTNIFNIWFELLPLVTFICLIEHTLKLPREDTIITLKVRLDN